MQLTFKLANSDNKKLANLCGPLDENIKQIATGFEISIQRRGSNFSLSGEDENIKLASQFIESLYLRSTKSISAEDIQLGLVEVNKIPFQKNESPELHTRKNDLQGRTPKQVAYLKNIQANDINFGIGPAGTGKTYLAVASAVDALNREKIKRIILVRPAVEAGERLGFLPGDLAQKVDPYLRPLYDALYDLAGYDNVTKLFEKGILEVAPLAYLRGRTLNNSFIIMDESQNTTVDQMKMFLTRMGFGSYAVINGDMTQIDLPKNIESGLSHALKVLDGLEDLGFTIFNSKDVVRHPLVRKIVDAYDKFDQ